MPRRLRFAGGGYVYHVLNRDFGRVTVTHSQHRNLSEWPEARPERGTWFRYVNGTETEAELSAVRRSVVCGAPYGNDGWAERTARRLRLESTLWPRGRPAKEPDDP